ncbi:MAG TPA: GNAT family N-acetyltransferase [Pyrinomonadaceae bacterium]|nr:GNAT family N-acetyltransferase [Pyrinomonadaceae bacterium]
MRPPEIFETERLLLRVPRPSDAQAIFEGYARDAEVVRYLVWRPHNDIGETEQFLERCAQGWASGDEFPWAVTLKEGGDLVGMMGLRLRGFKADVGYVFARRWWGRGFAAEALRPVVGWALSQPAVFRVWALCDVDNAASARVLEKVGMTREGLLRRNTLHPNVSDEPRDSYCYAVVK